MSTKVVVLDETGRLSTPFPHPNEQCQMAPPDGVARCIKVGVSLSGVMYRTSAIREIGTNALPYLLRDLDPPEESRLRRWLVKLLRKQTFVKMRLRTSDEKSRQATWAFKALGPVARPAIQKLVPLLERNPGYVPGALAGIGPDAVPHLCRALDSSNALVRGNTAAYLANAV